MKTLIYTKLVSLRKFAAVLLCIFLEKCSGQSSSGAETVGMQTVLHYDSSSDDW